MSLSVFFYLKLSILFLATKRSRSLKKKNDNPDDDVDDGGGGGEVEQASKRQLLHKKGHFLLSFKVLAFFHAHF